MAGSKRECVVQRAAGYTVMSNYHLRDKALGLKAKGLLSVMLSLPEDWDYTIAGLAVILDEGKHVIRTAVQELEKAGYITRQQLAGEGGKFGGNQYIIREVPEPLSNFPTTENPMTENPSSENCTEIITEELITDESIPPVSPEKAEDQPKGKRTRKNRDKAEQKGQGGNSDLVHLPDAQMENLLAEKATALANKSHWSEEELGSFLAALRDFYGKRHTNGKPPVHTARGVNGLFSKIAPNGASAFLPAVTMLLTAIERGWTSVYPEKGQGRPGAAPAPTVEGMGERMC